VSIEFRTDEGVRADQTEAQTSRPVSVPPPAAWKAPALTDRTLTRAYTVDADAEEESLARDERWGTLVDLYRARMPSAEAPPERAMLLHKIASVEEFCRDDEQRAFETLLQAYELVPTDPAIVESIDRVGRSTGRIGELADKTKRALGEDLRGRRIALWGLAFKPGTDDMREAPSLTLIDALLGEGVSICAHDPAAMDHTRTLVGNRIDYAETNYEALEGADALVVVTDWNEYRHPDFARVKRTLKQPVIVDGRNLYDPEKMREHGIRYYSIGRTAVEHAAPERVGEYA
jgi:hypothetical protein